MTDKTPAGWYDNPDGSNTFRYFDGDKWTDHTSPKAGGESPPESDLQGVVDEGESGPRPWFKKKRFIIPAALVVIVVLGAAIGGLSEDAEPPAADNSESTSDSDKEKEKKDAKSEDETEKKVKAKKPDPKPKKPAMTSEQENAVWSAENYLSMLAFSESGLIEQLEFEGYSNADATFAVQHLKPDWNEQAAKSAENYLDTMPFSRSGLVEQLQFDGFTPEQAEHGVNAAGL